MKEIDELNNMSEDEILDISEYFNEMDLTEEGREKRKEFSESMVDIMLFIFALFSVMRKYNYINKQYVIKQLQSRYSELVLKYMDVDKVVDNYIKKISVIEYEKSALFACSSDIELLAECEGLRAHANSIKVRREKEIK